MWGKVSRTALEVVFCRAHEQECVLLRVVWKNELPFIFIVCVLSLSWFAERGDGACIDHNIAVIVTPGAQGHCDPPKFSGEK